MRKRSVSEQRSGNLRTLAAAYAQNGRFADAKVTAEKGLALAADNVAFTKKLREEAKSYEVRIPAPQ